MTHCVPPLRLHIHTDPDFRQSRDFAEARVLAIRDEFEGLAARLALSFSQDEADLEAALAEVEVLIVVGALDLADVAARAPRLRWIHITSAGVDRVPLDRLPPQVLVTNAKGNHEARTREFSMTALLMLNNQLPLFVTQQRERRWAQAALEPIEGKTVVILGMGALGSAAARAAKQLGLKVVGVSRSGKAHELADISLPQSRLKEALADADFLLITLPLTPETHSVVGEAELAAMPAHGGVINIGRGPVLDVAALAQRLEAGQLRGAVLDVFPEEPLPADSPYWRTRNLIVLPHSGLYDADYVPRCLRFFFANVERYLDDRPLENRVDTALGY
ncbi:D-2-hydroxyacid dehydrogenase [Salinicola avicenniae]|uniref:D-2-hydroxyacid dehydrogenase n=1 Tax=Salinicola avicenniae TaxID=2916836 RepID=UPI00207460AA|nr:MULTISPECIES: D-2-hydroxyacid dehydrogenase [unclassified Salinicola]